MVDRLGRKLLFSIGLGAIVFLALSLFVDFEHLAAAFSTFEWRYLIAALFLAAVNYCVRYVRWHLYVRRLGIPLPAGESMVVFMAGLILSVTPGKAGEVLKAFLVKARTGTPVSRGAAAVFAERVTDFISLILLASIGILSSRQSPWLLVLSLAGLLGLTLLVGLPGVVTGCLDRAERLPLLARVCGPVRRGYEGARCLLSPLNLVWALGLATVAWFAECLGFYFVLAGFGAGVGVVQSTFVYSFATIVGALTMLPGGIGPTEGSMSGLLVLRGVELPVAVGATFVIRVCTLWFAVAVGAVAMFVAQGRLKGFRESSELYDSQGVQEGD
jgi:glycosyltransferase 2 family protein